MSAGLEPPGLDRNLGTEERAVVLAEVLQADAALQRLAMFVNVAESDWPQDIKALFSRSPVRTERPGDVLRRWWNLFQDEVALVHHTRNRLVHQVRVSDAELLKASWLANHLIEITSRSR
jgi:hypothetical protein